MSAIQMEKILNEAEVGLHHLTDLAAFLEVNCCESKELETISTCRFQTPVWTDSGQCVCKARPKKGSNIIRYTSTLAVRAGSLRRKKAFVSHDLLHPRFREVIQNLRTWTRLKAGLRLEARVVRNDLRRIPDWVIEVALNREPDLVNLRLAIDSQIRDCKSQPHTTEVSRGYVVTA